MELDVYINKFKNARFNFFKWREELSFMYKLSLAFNFAFLIALMSQFRFYIPGTPIPLTGQVFGVLLAGVLLGAWGGVSLSMYVGLGAIGVPWFAGFGGGLAYLAGPTGGYIIGFIMAAFFIGYLVNRYPNSRKFSNLVLLMLFSVLVLIYVPGLTQFYLWTGGTMGVWKVITVSVIPFLFFDAIKTVIAAGIATTILPKKSFL